ncbi:exported hypothetical protein [Agrobacterium salinitolerans str. Hayward 0363]|nr:exported hypothetical protein [Agrobacterium salinitolerans str. Hayward 0363]
MGHRSLTLLASSLPVCQDASSPAYELRPVFDALIADLRRSTKLSMDETRAPVFDPCFRKNQDRILLGTRP